MNEDNIILYIIGLALLPVIILLFYIYNKDKYAPEPVGQLAKAFFYGVLSAPLSLFISQPLLAMGFYPENSTDITGSITASFFGAAIPEEAAKLFMLWLLLRKNKYFDEKMDGIVYAVFVSMGFAAFENILYLFGNIEIFVTIGVVRGLFSIPGHFAFGVLMGYFYSLAVFYSKNSNRNKILIFAAPVIAHGLFDTLLMAYDVTPGLISVVLIIAFLVLCHNLWKQGSMRIKEHLKRDGR